MISNYEEDDFSTGYAKLISNLQIPDRATGVCSPSTSSSHIKVFAAVKITDFLIPEPVYPKERIGPSPITW